MKIGFDNEKYLKMQSEHIRNRIGKFGGKLYLEFGGKLFDDYHASRVLPGFEPDSKLRLLKELSDQAEIVFAISAKDIEKNKIRGDLGITYDSDVLRLMQIYQGLGLYVGSVVITKYNAQESAELFKNRLEKLGIKVYRHYLIPGYPTNVPFIVSDDGYGKNDYIKTSRPLVVVTAPGPGSGKMAVCLSQLYHEHKHGIKAGYAKFETFPIWNIPLKHPVNLAYEAATADLNDVNMGAIPLIIITAREFMVSGLRLLAADSGVVVAAGIWGKLKTAFTMVAIVAILFWLSLCGDFSLSLSDSLVKAVDNVVIPILIWISTILTVVSGVVYLKGYWHLIDSDK